MTAFGNGKVMGDYGSVSIEIKTVNSRYLDIQFRMPDELRLAEHPIREQLSKNLSRGKVEIRASFSRAQAAIEQRLSDTALTRISEQLGRVRRVLPETASPRLSEILGWSEQQQSSVEPEVWGQACLAALAPALEQLIEGRIREGARLAQTMLVTAQEIRAIVDLVESQMPTLLQTQRDKLASKLKETIQNAFPSGFTHITGTELSERIASESSLFALRIDVAEELARLKSHLAELEFLLNKDSSPSKQTTAAKNTGSTGKRLDFLFQEMNREANTLGSKAGSLDMTRAAMDLKLLIEQMREQAMNIE
jgi:uncharacterized protein (TIGR00255 family)